MASGVITRETLLTLGRGSEPWRFVPLAFRALSQVPHDLDLRLLLAAHLARLKLRTLASEVLEPALASSIPQARDLAVALGRHAADHQDVVTLETREACLLSNLSVLARRHPHLDLREHLAAWRLRAAQVECFRAAEGNVLRRRRTSQGSVFTHLHDHVGQCAKLTLPKDPASDRIPMIVVEGADPPQLLSTLAERSGADALGYSPRLILLQRDPLELLDGLSFLDLGAVLSASRFELFLGERAGDDFRSFLAARLDEMLDAIVLTTAASRLAPSPAELLAGARATQEAELTRLTRELGECYATPPDLAARRAPGQPPLRLLIPTTRFSTFIRHSASDLAHAFAAAGCDCRVLQEPDDHSRLAPLAYARALASLRPDACLLINYTRAQFPILPRHLPLITWVQDAMPHLFAPAQGAAGNTPAALPNRELDVLVGNLYPELCSASTLSAKRLVPTPVLASGAKFHPRPADAALRERLACDLAYVGHQSATPQRLRDDLAHRLSLGGMAPQVARALLERFYTDLVAFVERPPGELHTRHLTSLTQQALAEVLGTPPTAEGVRVMRALAVDPLADRLYRHQTLTWAAEIATARGYRFRIFGSGWEKHDTLAAFASPPLTHGEELRAAYQAARVHLHASLTAGTYHQRVFECFLSGGVCLVRLREEDLGRIADRVRDVVFSTQAPEFCMREHRAEAVWAVNHPEAVRQLRLQQKMGLALTSLVLCDPDRASHLRASPVGEPEHESLAWILSDPAEVGFWSKETLESRLRVAVELPAWRERVNSTIFPRVESLLTYEGFAPRILAALTGYPD